jgi:hypothetical protein
MRIKSEQIKEAFIKVAEAEEAVQIAKRELALLYAKSEEVVNARWVVENCKHLAPSDDTQDVAFARLQKAEQDLTQACVDGCLQTARKSIEKCYECNGEAYLILK